MTALQDPSDFLPPLKYDSLHASKQEMVELPKFSTSTHAEPATSAKSVRPWAGLLFAGPVQESPTSASKPSPRRSALDSQQAVKSSPRRELQSSSPRNFKDERTKPMTITRNTQDLRGPSPRKLLPNALADMQSSDLPPQVSSIATRSPFPARNQLDKLHAHYGNQGSCQNLSELQQQVSPLANRMEVPPLSLEKLNLRNLSNESPYFSARYNNQSKSGVPGKVPPLSLEKLSLRNLSESPYFSARLGRHTLSEPPRKAPPLPLGKLSLRNLRDEPPYSSARLSSRTVSEPPANISQQLHRPNFKAAISGLTMYGMTEDRLHSENFKKWAAAEGLDHRGRDLRPRRPAAVSRLVASPRIGRSASEPNLPDQSNDTDTEEEQDMAAIQQDPQMAMKDKLALQNMDVAPPRELPPVEAGKSKTADLNISLLYAGESSDEESVDFELYDKIIANIENASRQVDVKDRLQRKKAHDEEVRRRGKEIEAERHERRKFAAERSRRIALNAANQRHYIEQCARVRKMAPLLSLVSKLGCLAHHIELHRKKAKFEEDRVFGAITIQRIFRGFRERKAYLSQYHAALKIQGLFRSVLIWRIRLWKKIRAKKIVEYLRDVKEMGEFSTLMKIAVARIVRERKKSSQMKVLSGAITRTVIMGQWASEERRYMMSRNQVDNILPIASETESSDGAINSSEVEEENIDQSQLMSTSLEIPPQDSLIISEDDGADKQIGDLSHNIIPPLVKILVIEAFVDYRSQQYTRVMGVYWWKLTLFRRLKRERQANQLKNIYVASRTKSARERQIEPVLFPKPRSCRMCELKVMMQQAAHELALMEKEGIWDLHGSRDFVPVGEELSSLTKMEQARVPEIQERLKLRFFMTNVSVKVGLMTKRKTGE